MKAFVVGLLLSFGAAGVSRGQMTPSGTGGVAALATALRQLGSNKRVLMIGAHPDDEDTQLLVLLSRGMGAQAAYLSLTRGEGGQNLIGPATPPAAHKSFIARRAAIRPPRRSRCRSGRSIR